MVAVARERGAIEHRAAMRIVDLVDEDSMPLTELGFARDVLALERRVVQHEPVAERDAAMHHDALSPRQHVARPISIHAESLMPVSLRLSVDAAFGPNAASPRKPGHSTRVASVPMV